MYVPTRRCPIPMLVYQMVYRYTMDISNGPAKMMLVWKAEVSFPKMAMVYTFIRDVSCKYGARHHKIPCMATTYEKDHTFGHV